MASFTYFLLRYTVTVYIFYGNCTGNYLKRKKIFINNKYYIYLLSLLSLTPADKILIQFIRYKNLVTSTALTPKSTT